MRIISKFHDYYDCIQRMGQDQTIVYLRRPETLKFWPFPTCSGVYGSDYKEPLTTVRVIGFCGKIIPLVELFDEPGGKPIRCWSIYDVDSFMRERLGGKAWELYRKSKWCRGFNHNRRRIGFQRFFEQCVQFENHFEKLFRDHHAPLFVATQLERRPFYDTVFNACLKDVGFYTRFDSYHAFQEIAMYMGGVLGTHGGHKTKYKGKPMDSNVSDKDLVIAKGFDKHSFRSSKRDPDD